jgi:cobalt-zinc-cadmium efflux system outer membrane protein
LNSSHPFRRLAWTAAWLTALAGWQTTLAADLPGSSSPASPSQPASSTKPATAGTASPAQTGGVYTLAGLENLMLETSPAVRSVRDQTRGAEAAVRTARTFPNPSLEVMNGRMRPRDSDVIRGDTKGYSVTQPLDMPWNRFPRVDGAEANFVGAQAIERASLAELKARVRFGFFDLIRRQAEQRAAEEDRQLTEDIRKRIALRVELGEAAKFELIKADAEMLMAQKSAQSAAARTRQARAVLRAIVGSELPEAFQVSVSPKDVGQPPPLDQLRDQIMQANPELQRLQAVARQSTYKLSEEKALRLPQLSLRADLGQDPDNRTKTTGVLMTLPLWDWRGGPVGEAAARLSQAQNDLQAEEFALLQRVETAYRQYEIAQAQVVALESGIVRQAENALRIAQTAYKAGEKGFLEVLDAQRVFRQARNELINARFELAGAWIEIERLRADP